MGADASNVAIAAARPGTTSGIASRVGSGGFAEGLMALWAREGVNAAAVARDPERRPGYLPQLGPAQGTRPRTAARTWSGGQTRLTRSG
ncbi:PfkB family carbohydrate kinase [Thermohalobaculum sediminis]|uniref:PfkB family carbohydrate kinase n=1 Tax=Thermohalobaculum sediminis TaxID=2939436 RepID=UPI003873AE2F